MVSHLLLQDLFKLALSTVIGKEALQPQGAGYFWNIIFSQGSEIEDQWLRDTCVARYSLIK